MSLLQAVLLGIVQGLTEFLPVSSSAHLVLVPWLLGWSFDPDAAFVFDVLVQLGTLAAVIVFFWKDLVALVTAAVRDAFRRQPLASPEARLAWLIVLATIPAAIAGVLFKGIVEQAFDSPLVVCICLLGTAAILFTADRLGRPVRALVSLRVPDAIWIGLAQVLSLLPGISRSGSTISAGILRGLDRREAARFSFLMSVPVMLGAGLIAGIDLARLPDLPAVLPPILIGALGAAITGYLAIRWLLAFLVRRPLTIFAIYCTIVGLGGILLALVRG
jgi:undecaprenyl-diphosphatase